jgi:hypothetical protein
VPLLHHLDSLLLCPSLLPLLLLPLLPIKRIASLTHQLIHALPDVLAVEGLALLGAQISSNGIPQVITIVGRCWPRTWPPKTKQPLPHILHRSHPPI